MNASEFSLKRAWIASGQGEPWNCQSTYCEVSWAKLPKIENASDDFVWLDQITPELRAVVNETSTLNSDDNQIGNLQDLIEKSQKIGLSFPPSFLRFLSDGRLQEKVLTCTACYLELSENFVPVIGAEGQYLLRFMNDSQCCVLWYLYFVRGQFVGVVASGHFLEPEIFEVMEYENLKRECLFKELVLCADSFPEFVYRFWIENSIWYSSANGVPFSQPQQDYRNRITS